MTTASLTPALPTGVTLLERGWLSSNNILIQGEVGTALIDSGYATHADQTVRLVAQALDGRSLDKLLCTHLHSDHCGGNAALQAQFPHVYTAIPPGQSQHVRHWNPDALSYTPTGQQCPPFRLDGLLQPGSSVVLGDWAWQVHAAPGHDPHAVVLFEPQSGTLVSGDALWENGFGVVFPELDGESGFAEVAATLDLIESLAPRVVIPGHGRAFGTVTDALATARKRLAGFVSQPLKHTGHAAKVLLKFKLLEWQRVRREALLQWALGTPYLARLHRHHAADHPVIRDWVEGLLVDLDRSGALRIDGDWVANH